MHVLDTDVLSITQVRTGEVYERLRVRLNTISPGSLYITIVTLEEQMRGWLSYISRAKSMAQQIQAYQRLQAFLDDIRLRPVLPFDDRAAAEFQRLRKAKIRIGTMDLKIAAIVLSRDATLISRNLADFRQVHGRRVEGWTLPVGA